ncbi:MAG: hypothetical protein JW717_14495 [Marinilabiliaceae bacterium]|nr:hypothetical protein [Marinilabiliaceae bacterium]
MVFNLKEINRLIVGLTILLILSACTKHERVVFLIKNDSERVKYGIERLTHTLKNLNYQAVKYEGTNDDTTHLKIVIGSQNDSIILIKLKENRIKPVELSKKESFRIISHNNTIIVIGYDESGMLYGCLELRRIIEEQKLIPTNINIYEHPEMVLRGAVVGLQKTAVLPGRKVYEYPYTPDNFPWFYDKDLWIRYLDMLVDNKMNSLYLWNGHPFASLLKLDDYPYAVEVDSVTLKLNEDIYSFLTHEADKRGIYVIQMFYNVILSKPFAEKHNLQTQDRSRELNPLISDYTRKSIAAFVEKYPNVGLLVCLGEAMNTIDDDVNWFTKTIIPGVKDGLNALGCNDEPPIILRGHDTDPAIVMQAALPVYNNLYTMHKYNGESLTTYEPRGPWTATHQSLSSIGTVHIENVHILANLEPFRYGSPDFIHKSVLAMRKIHGANGLHLYPQASYWDWPYAADSVIGGLLQIDRDWLWYEAWARYAWNSKRNRADELKYWGSKLGDYFGCGDGGKDILDAYEQIGEIAPKLLRRFGITDGNRQTLSLGMFMSQLVNPHKWRIYPSFYESNGPEGEILIDYAKKDWFGEKHLGETPPQIVFEVVIHAEEAIMAIDKAAPFVTKNKEEFVRLKNDVYCYHALAHFYAEKVNAALNILRYSYSNDITDLEIALLPFQRSVIHFSRLVSLTEDSYRYANSMQTNMRRIPADGNDGINKTWNDLLPQYQEELLKFKNNLLRLKNNRVVENSNAEILKPVDVEFLNDNYKWYQLKKGVSVYSDVNYYIKAVSNELMNLKGVKLNYQDQLDNGTSIRFKSDQPVKVLVGYYNGHSFRLLNPPSLETDATANDKGQADIRIANALDIDGLFPVNVYSYKFEAGEHELKLGKGIALVMGFIDGNIDIDTYDAGIVKGEYGKSVDWLFY